jgi:hypothetical protein
LAFPYKVEKAGKCKVPAEPRDTFAMIEEDLGASMTMLVQGGRSDHPTASAHIPLASSVIPVMKIAASNPLSQLLRMARLNCFGPLIV